MRKNNTSLIFYLSILTLLLSAGAFVFFFKIIQNKNEHTATVLNTLQSKMAEKRNADELEKKIAEVKASKNVIDDYLVRPTQIDSFVDYLEKLGTTGNAAVTVKNVEISPKDKNIVIVGISINGSFSHVMQTLSLIENMPHSIHITSAYLNKQVAKAGEGQQWQADITFTILSAS
jgi:Tfp pilus assembly protein PilO